MSVGVTVKISSNIEVCFFQDHCIGSDLEIVDRELNGTYLPYSQGIEMDIFIRDPRNPDEYLEGNLWCNIAVLVNVTVVNTCPRH